MAFWKFHRDLQKFRCVGEQVKLRSFKTNVMQEIIGAVDTEKRPGSIFSKLAFGFSLLTLQLFIWLISSIPSTIKASEGLPVPPKGLVIADWVACAAGFVSTILSYVLKEK
jgi:hypothetical protein